MTEETSTQKQKMSFCISDLREKNYFQTKTERVCQQRSPYKVNIKRYSSGKRNILEGIRKCRRNGDQWKDRLKWGHI